MTRDTVRFIKHKREIRRPSRFPQKKASKEGADFLNFFRVAILPFFFFFFGRQKKEKGKRAYLEMGGAFSFLITSIFFLPTKKQTFPNFLPPNCGEGGAIWENGAPFCLPHSDTKRGTPQKKFKTGHTFTADTAAQNVVQYYSY